MPEVRPARCRQNRKRESEGDETVPLMFCGVFNCTRNDCDYHIKNGDNFEMPSDFRNLKNTEVCKLDRDCDNCKNKVDGDCQVWDCRFEKREE